MNSRTRKPSKSPHKAASTPNTHLETKITQKKMQTHRENSENQCLETPVKNNRENYMPTGTGAVKDDNENSEKTRIFYSSDEEQDDINAIFEPKVSKSQNSFPRTNSEVNLKERKFFKRSYPETLNHGICLSPRTVELQEENVSKVFKILSKSVSTPNFSESKPSKRLPLKTYSTPRKPKTNIIESFGLPDTPIIPEFPSKFDELDVGVTDAKDVTVCDMPFFEVDEVLPLKQYEKGYNCNISKQDNEDEAIFVQKNTSDHKILIEKMKNQIRRLLSDSPTRTKEKSTSTPIQTNKLSVLACDVSCIEDNSLDMEIFNTSDKTGILFSLPDLSHNENKIEKIKNVISTTSTSFKRALRSSDSSGKDDKTQNAYSSFESSDKVNTPKSKSDMRSNSKKRGNKSVQSDKADETVNVCSSFESSDRVNMPKSKSDRSNSKKRGNKPVESDKGDKIENVCSSFESSDKVNTRKNKSDKRSNSKKRGNKSEESEKDEKMCIASSSFHSNEKVKTPTNKSNKRSNSKKRGNKSEESDKDEKMCIASSSFHSNEEVKTPTNKSDERSNSKKRGNKCAQSSTISDFTDKINKRQTRSNTSKQLQSPNYGLELKVLLNPLSENVLSNYSVYQNLSNISLKDNLKTCQQFLEHEKQNICQPFDSSIVCSILGDWENAESEVFPQKNTQTPIKFNSAYEFNEISPDKIIEKLSYKNKCRSVVALLTDQDALNESPKTENHLSDKKEIRNEFINNKIGNKMNVKPVPKEEVKLPQIEGNNFSIIQYMSIEESYENVQQQEILIFETSNNLELVVNKENSLMNGSEVVENDESLFYDETETNSEDLQNLQNSLSDGIKITNEEKSIVDKADENDLNLVISGEKVQDTSMESPNNTGCHIIRDNNISNTVPRSVENKTNESNLGPQELSQNQDSNNSVPLQCKPYSLNGFSENSFKESLHSKPKKLIESAKGLEKNNFGKQLDIILVNSDIQFQYQPDLNPKKNSKTPYINSTQIEKPVALEFESQIVAPENPYNISTEMGDHFKELINGEKHIKNEMSVKEPNIIDNCVTVSQCSQHIIEDYIEEFQKDPSETSVTVLQKKSEINETQSSSDIEEVCQHKNDSESKRKRVKKPYYKCRSSTRLEKSPFRTDTEDEVLDNCDYSSTKSDTEVNYIKELTECEKGKTSKANFDKDKNSAEAMEPNNTEMEKGVEADKNDETMGIELNNFKKQLDVILINGDHQIEFEGLKNKTHKKSIQLEHGIIRTKSLENEPVEDSDQSTAPIHIRHSDNEQQILDNHFENSSISGDIIGKEITVSDRNSSEVNSLALHTNSEGNEQQSPDSPITNDAEIKRKKMYFKCRSSIRLEKSHIPVTTDIENEFIENLESLTTRSDNGVIGSTKLTEDEATKKILENVEGNQSTAAIHNTHSDNGPTILDDHFENSPCSGYIIGKGVTESDGTLIENNPSEGNSLALHENLEEDELQSPDSPITDDTEMKRKSLKKMYFKCRSSIRLEKSHIPVTTDIETEFIENSASLPTENDSGVIGSTELTEQEATKKKALEKVEGKTETPKLENITVERSVKQLGPEEDMEKEIDYNSKDNATTKNSSAINEVSGDTDPAYVKLKDIVKNHNEMDMNDVQSENDSLPPQNMPTPTEKPGRLRKKSFIRVTDDQLNSTDNCTISSKAQKSDFSQDEVDIEGTLEKNTVGEENKTNTLVDDHNVLVSPKTGRKPPKKTPNEVMDNQLNNTGHNESCFTTGEGKVTTVEDAEGNKKKLATEPDTLMSPKNRRRQRKKSQGHQLLNNTDNYVGFSKAHEYDSNSSADEGEIRAVDQKTVERDASNTATTVQISNALMSPRKKGKPHKKPLVEVTDDELYNTDNIIDGKNVAIEDAVNADTLVNDFNILVSPRKKGRPRKKPFIEITDDEITIIDNNIVLPKAHDSYSSLNENEIKSLGEKVAIGDEACTDSSVNEPNLILIPKKKGRPRKKTRKTAMGNSVITATLVNKPNMLLPKKKGRPHKKPLIEVTDVQLNNTFSSIDSPKAHIDEDENKAAKETVAMGDADNVVTVLNEFNDLERPRKRGRPRKKLLTEVTDDHLNKKDNSIDSSKRNNSNSSLDEDEIESVGAIEDVNRMDPNVLMSPKKKGRPRKIVSSSVEDICNIPKRKGRPRKNSNLQERESIVPITSPLAKTETQNILVSASPKAFEGFEKTEKTEECNNVCHLNLEQIEAELVAIEYQKEGGEFAPLFRKLTRSKSRAALKDVEEDTNLISDKDVQLPRRSKTSLGLVLKNSPDFPRRSKGRPRASGTVEGETSNDSGKSMFESIKKKKDKYNLGTLAWARIGGYPYWPCLVTKEPDNNVFKKDSFMAGSMKTIYHVRFFGDKGKRAWVVKTKMMPYNDKNDVELLLKKAKEENKPLHERLPYMIRPLYVEKWKKAVNEAEQLKESPLPEKLSFFEQIDIRRKIEKLARKSDHDLPGTSKRKRKDSMSTISSETSQITDFQDESPTRKRYKKDGTSKRVSEEEIAALSKKCKDPPQPAEPEPVVIPPYVPILDNENILPSRTRSGLHNEVNSDIMPKVSSEKTATPPDPFSIEAQRSLFRRNNLFKGVSKEKACQYCYQPDMVFKCTKGGCNGLYHLQCSVDVMTGEEYNKRKNNRKSSQSTVIELNPNENDPKSSETTGNNPPDDRVQIVTVTSHIYNTPPRKTFPENFQAMSLAEQIDFKMKEVMRKFENRTLYAESSTDSSSEESSVAKMISMIKNSPNVKLTFDHLTPDKNILDEKFTDKPNGTFPDIPRKNRTSIVKHVTADSVIEMSSDESSPSTTRHVTADSVEVNEKVDKGKTLLKKLVTAESDLERTPSESSCSTISQQSKEMLDPKNFKCGFCLSRTDPYCFICRQAVTAKGSLIRQKCSLYQCGRYFHPECLKLWPQTQWSFIQTTKHRTSKEEFDTFVCPQHVCHTCSSDDPRAATSRCSGDKIVKCLRCPASYHSTNFCIPAGTEIISTTQVICPRHRDRKKATINTTWCFLCSEGGNLICCETCPTSVHPECMPVNLTDDDKFICEDCESGRLPLYDEIVWVKLGAFRWWPALILFPNEVPPNVMNARHSAGEFVVRFFGTYDHYWVSRSRSFLFQDGDAGQTTSTKKKVDEAFNRAVEEAVVAHKAKKEFKRTREVESLNSLKPPPYIRIKVNRPVGNVRQLDLDLSSTTSCDCNPNKPNPCEPDSDCLNRLLMTECNPEVCPAGQRCKNQSFEKREYPPMTPYKTEGRGWGLKALAPIKKGQFVIEYVGELIDMEEYQRRIQKMHEQKEENYYFLTIDKDRMIDAGPKGNLARFMNHCCLPNCETQKWTVNGDTRVGLFATVDIPAETELTFNYNLECVGKERKICRCGAPTCSGFIGVQKEKQESDVKKIKRSYKKKQPVEQAVLPPCFICQRKGNVGLCNNKVCNKAYHLRCLNMTEWPEGNKFVCPWHNCNICSKRTIRCCVKCINSFCPSHSEGNIRYDNLLGFVCSSHDPTKPQSDNPVRMKARRSHVITEESAVTSTTSDDSDKEDDMLLSDRINQKEHIEMEAHSSKRPKKGKKRTSNRTSSEEFEVSNSTSLSVVQDEYNVSSATPCGSEQTRRKKSVKRNDQTRKKIRLSSLGNNKRKSTARSNLNSRQLDDR